MLSEAGTHHWPSRDDLASCCSAADTSAFPGLMLRVAGTSEESPQRFALWKRTKGTVVSELGLPLADELADLAARMPPLLLSVDKVTAAVEVLTELAEETIATATGAGVSLMDDHGRRTSKAATSSIVLEADDLQYRLNEGPCLKAEALGSEVSAAPIRGRRECP